MPTYFVALINFICFIELEKMSRSRRKLPIIGNCLASSEKEEKIKANRKLRRLVKTKLSRSNIELPQLKEISNKWNWPKDGKSYRSDLTNKQLSK